MTELIESPLTYYFKEAGVELRQLAVRTGPPRALVFSHKASNTLLPTFSRNNNVCFSCLCYSPDMQIAAFYRYEIAPGQGIKMDINVVFTKFAQNVPSVAKYYNIRDNIVHMNMSNSILFAQHKNNPNITISALIGLGSNCSLKTTLRTASLPENFVPIGSFALINEDAVLCCNSAQPLLYIWSSETDIRRQVDIKFAEPTKVTHITAGPGRSVLCFCEQVVEDNRSWYKPDPPRPDNSLALALVDVDSGTILWQRSRSDEDNPLTHVMDYSGGYFFMKISSGIKIEIIDATNGNLPIYCHLIYKYPRSVPKFVLNIKKYSLYKLLPSSCSGFPIWCTALFEYVLIHHLSGLDTLRIKHDTKIYHYFTFSRTWLLVCSHLFHMLKLMLLLLENGVFL